MMNLLKFVLMFVLLNTPVFAAEESAVGVQVGQDVTDNTKATNTGSTNNSEEKSKDTVDIKQDSSLVQSFDFTSRDEEVEKVINSGYGKTLDIKNPIFLLSEGINSLNYIYSNNLCNVINIADKTVNCVVYPVENKADIPSYIRRGSKSDKYDESGGINGDFLLVRIDSLMSYYQNRGYLKGAPLLDVVAFLNGDYMFMFANKAKNSFSLEQMLFNKGVNATVNIGYLNPQSRKVFEGVLKPLFPKYRFSFTQIKGDNLSNVICRPSNIDLIIYLGGNFPSSLKSIMAGCSSSIVPITLSSSTINSILQEYPVFSAANVISYYDPIMANNFLDTYLNVEKVYKQRLLEQQILEKSGGAGARSESSDESKNVQSVAPEQSKDLTKSLIPQNRQPTRAEINAKRIQEEQIKKAEEKATLERKKRELEALQKQKQLNQTITSASDNNNNDILLEMSKKVTFKNDDLARLPGQDNVLSQDFSGVFPNIRSSLVPKNQKKLYLSGIAEVRTFGMRYVLVASRYARKTSVITMFDGLIKNYFTEKATLLTPDMNKFSIKDIVLGSGLNDSNYAYHYAIIDYPKILLERKAPRTNEQNLAIRAIVTGINSSNITKYSGPNFPDNAQLNYIYNRLKDLNKRKQELIAIKVFQRDVTNIQQALEAIKKGEKIPDSVLESTGLYTTDSTVEDISVLPNITINDLK